jgi:hypothetical protein
MDDLVGMLEEASDALRAAGHDRFAEAAQADALLVRDAGARHLLGDCALSQINDMLLPGDLRGLLRAIHRRAHELTGEPLALCCGRPKPPGRTC